MKRSRPTGRKPAAPTHTLRRWLEALEDRAVPAALSVADVTVREGPASLGILAAPGGATSVGVTDIRNIALDGARNSLILAGGLSHAVARFDFASQQYHLLVPPDSGGLGEAYGITVGPDGHVYVSDPNQNAVFRYDGSTGAPLPAPGRPGAVFVADDLATINVNESGGLTQARGITFGADGSLYVCSRDTNQILRYQGPTGSSPGSFQGVFASIANASSPTDLTFGPDGNLYVSLFNMGVPQSYYGQVNRYDGATGAPIGTGVFVPLASGGLVQPRQLVFDPQGTNLYVVVAKTWGGEVLNYGEVLRYQGPAAPTPGAFVEAYVSGAQGGLRTPIGLARDTAGELYVSARDTGNVTRFAPTTQARFTVRLDAAGAVPVSVDYATADGTALAGSDYVATSGTLTFAPGETERTVAVTLLDDLAGEPTETFRVNLSNAVNAAIADGQGISSILDNETKFYVVDDTAGSPRTFEYGSGGSPEEISSQLAAGTIAPRGAATTAAGTTLWVVAANKVVYVFNTGGALLGSWSAGSLPGNAQVEGIATNGTDIWLLDGGGDKVYRYAGAAGRLSGTQNAAGNFKLTSANANGKGVVTDGASFWVVDDGNSTDKVFKYTLTGSMLGSWAIDPANARPTGLTINPANVSDIWVVDNGTDKVYQYTAAAGRTSGSQTASTTFALTAGNTNPQDIADPPTIGIADAEAVEGGTTYRYTDMFVAPDGYGLAAGRNILVGPDGNVYVASHDTDVVKVFEGGTGRFLRDLSTTGGEMDGPWGMVFGVDGRLYVGGRYSHNIVRFDVGPGTYAIFVAENSGGLGPPLGLAFGLDGNLYASSRPDSAPETSAVKRYSGVSGAYLGDFVTAGSAGLHDALGLAFGPDGNLYVCSEGSRQVKRYNGQSGAFIDNFVPAGSGGLVAPFSLVFRGDGYLYVGSRPEAFLYDPKVFRYSAVTGAFVDVFATFPLPVYSANGVAFAPSGEFYVSFGMATQQPGSYVARFAPSSFSAFAVGLDASATSPVSVNFATANGTTVAGSDYAAASGTLTFAPGETTRTILVRTLDDTLAEPAETFTVNLTNPVGATITDAQAIGTITDNDPLALRVSSVAVNGGAAQRSRVTQLAVTFSGVATLPANPAAAFRLNRIGGGQVGGFTATANTVGGVTVVTLTSFTGAETQGGSLADGRYTLTVLANQVTTPGGLDGNGDGTAGDDYVLDGTVANGLFRLFGDVNGDGAVSGGDFGSFRLAFGTVLGDPGYLDYLDFDGDGSISGGDFGNFRIRFGTIVP